MIGFTITVLVTPEQTSGASVTMQVDAPPGLGLPAHIHTREDEIFVVTRGHLRFWHGKQVVDANPGTVVYMPRNEAHQFRNIGNTAGTVIMTIMPAGLEQMFLTISQRNLTVAKDLPEIVRLATQYGITKRRAAGAGSHESVRRCLHPLRHPRHWEALRELADA